MMPSNYSTDSTTSPDHQQLNLFPLRPSSSIVDADVDNNSTVNVEYLFNSAADDGSATTLTSIFGSTTTGTTSSTSSSSMTISTEDQHTFNDGILLEQTALRKKELRDRTHNEEDQRWVCYSEVMSGGGGTGNHDHDHDHEMKMMKMTKRRRRRLELKLDYQQIINTWGRSFIHIQMESPATVPDLHNPNHHHHHQSMFMISPHDQTGGETSMGGWGYNNDGGLWSVPEAEKKWCNNNNTGENVKIKEELGVESGQHLREASMLRYKEKRQSRLFSKRIRYQVRKINAEKRPRIKGRFVKRS